MRRVRDTDGGLVLPISTKKGRRSPHGRLSENFERAMRNRQEGRNALRLTVRQIIERGTAAGAQRDKVADALMSFLAHHPRRAELDRVSLVDGTRASDRLLEQIRVWIAELAT
jgi:hypothetical protein